MEGHQAHGLGYESSQGRLLTKCQTENQKELTTQIGSWILHTVSSGKGSKLGIYIAFMVIIMYPQQVTGSSMDHAQLPRTE